MSDWIKVEDRLPETQCHLLVATSTGLVESTFYTPNREFFRLSGSSYSRKTQGKESGYFEIAYKRGYRIIHWMWLPSHPDDICPF